MHEYDANEDEADENIGNGGDDDDDDDEDDDVATGRLGAVMVYLESGCEGSDHIFGCCHLVQKKS